MSLEPSLLPSGENPKEAKKSKKKFRVIINLNYCKRCGICVEFCPVKNLILDKNVLKELNMCSGCRLCEVYCPDFAIYPEEKKE